MSRIGKQPIAIPQGVTVTLADGRCVVRGPKGVVEVPLHAHVTVREADGALHVGVARPNAKEDRALWGLTARLLQNAVAGTVQEFERKLEIQGVGFRVALKGSTLEFNLGYSHPVTFALPEGITAAVEKNVVTIRGIDKQRVGQVAAQLRSLRKPDAYHGKGVRYFGEVLKLKPGKAAKGAGG